MPPSTDDRIIIVDDDELILRALSHILQSHGYSTVTYKDPVEAAEARNFAVVISDYNMPHINGIELLNIYKQVEPTAVRMLMTAMGDFKLAQAAVNRGEVFRILAKPWDVSELLSTVKQALDYHHLRLDNQRLGAELKSKNEQLTVINQNLERLVTERTNGLLAGMVAALDVRDTETQWHSKRVMLFTRRLGQEVGMTEKELLVVEQGAMLHDIGKIGVRDAVLLKPGPLSPDEWVEMRMHPEIGFRMLADIPYLYEASQIVLQHQEKWNGNGYPKKLAGEAIVLGARIFAIADALDAITSDRPYRRGSPHEVAKREIQRGSGVHFDPYLVEKFFAIPDSEWDRIRKEVETMANDELVRWNGKNMEMPWKKPKVPPPAHFEDAEV